MADIEYLQSLTDEDFKLWTPTDEEAEEINEILTDLNLI